MATKGAFSGDKRCVLDGPASLFTATKSAGLCVSKLDTIDRAADLRPFCTVRSSRRILDAGTALDPPADLPGQTAPRARSCPAPSVNGQRAGRDPRPQLPGSPRACWRPGSLRCRLAANAAPGRTIRSQTGNTNTRPLQKSLLRPPGRLKRGL